MGLKQFHNKPRRKLKKGLWSPDEDDKLRRYIHIHGVGCWNTVPINAGLLRNGKSCRLRWINYLRPGLKRETFSLEEEEKILRLHNKMGNKWSQMARCLPGRTDNEIKNHWHTNLKKGRGNKDGFITLTDADDKKCISTTHENNPPSSITTIPYACSNESFGKTGVSLTYIDQALSNLPKVFFTEWLTIDQTHGEVLQSNLGNPLITRDLQEEYKTNFQNSSMQSLLLSEEMLYESILNGIQNSSTYGVFYPTTA